MLCNNDERYHKILYMMQVFVMFYLAIVNFYKSNVNERKFFRFCYSCCYWLLIDAPSTNYTQRKKMKVHVRYFIDKIKLKKKGKETGSKTKAGGTHNYTKKYTKNQLLWLLLCCAIFFSRKFFVF